ncbi:MAG TPA: GNAT family N-acetyltransferase [Pararobbsia sp.]|nr:GNAT family N-acetyltransferase [Pararobbsia sp.]
MNWTCKTFAELSSLELYHILRARSAVFVVEQSCVRLDIDGKDERAVHLFAQEPAPMPIAAYARLSVNEDDEPEVLVDRLFTNAQRRGDGTAERLLDQLQREVAVRWPGHLVRLSAPTFLKSFYEQFRFRKVDGPYLDYGMPHIGMSWRAPTAVDAVLQAQRATREPSRAPSSLGML